MTLRDLIKSGVNLDDEIMIEARTYNNEGVHTGTYFSYSEEITMNRHQKKTVILIAEVEPV